MLHEHRHTHPSPLVSRDRHGQLAARTRRGRANNSTSATPSAAIRTRPDGRLRVHTLRHMAPLPLSGRVTGTMSSHLHHRQHLHDGDLYLRPGPPFLIPAHPTPCHGHAMRTGARRGDRGVHATGRSLVGRAHPRRSFRPPAVRRPAPPRASLLYRGG